MNDKFYKLCYQPDGFGCPHYLSGEYNVESFEWENFEPNPDRLTIQNTYTFNVTDDEINTLNFDFYGDVAPIVSNEFIAICDALNVKRRIVPLQLSLNGTIWNGKVLNLLLPCQSEQLLDRVRSEFAEERVVETGAVMMNRIHPGVHVYAWIKRFSTLPTNADLFWCIELLEICVSEKFKRLALANNLHGLKFIPIDESFFYDPWGEMPN